MALNIPAPRVPIIDPRTGYVSREWYLYFLSLSGSDLSDFDLSPSQQGSDTSALQSNDESIGPMFLGETSRSSGFDLTPPYEPIGGDFLYAIRNLDDIHAVINTGKTLDWTSVVTRRGIDVLSGTLSRIRVSSPGTYRVQAYLQTYYNAGVAGTVYMWLRRNGGDIGSSMVRYTGSGTSHDRIVSRNWMVDMSSGDYIELVWAVSDITIQILYNPLTAWGPSNPAAALSINKVS